MGLIGDHREAGSRQLRGRLRDYRELLQRRHDDLRPFGLQRRPQICRGLVLADGFDQSRLMLEP